MTQTRVEPQVSVKRVPPLDVVVVRARVEPRDVGRLFAAAGRKLHGTPAGAPLVIYHDGVILHGAFIGGDGAAGHETFAAPGLADVEVAFPVSSEAEETLLPVVAATLRHQGRYARLDESYARLLGWVASHGLRQRGPAREVYLVGPGDVDDPADFVTEIQVPVEWQEADGA